MKTQRPAAKLRPLLQIAEANRGLQDVHVLFPANLTEAQCRLLVDIRRQLIVYLQEQFRVLRIPCEEDDVPNVLHHPMGEEDHVRVADSVGNAPPLQKVYQGQGALIVPVEDGGLYPALLRHFGQVGVLGAAAL